MEEIKDLEITKRTYSTGRIENFLDKLIRGKGSFVLRKGTEVNELIFDNKLTIGSWKLTRRGTLIIEALFLLALLALVGFAGYIETMEVGI